MPRALLVLLVVLVVLLGLAPGARAATGYGIEVLRTTADGLSAAPGEVVTAGFRVSAEASVPEIQESLELPEGWTPITPPTSFRLGPERVRLRMLAFQVAPHAAPGPYEIRFHVVDPNNPGIVATAPLAVIVRSVSRLSIEVVDPPEYVVAGDTASVTLRLANLGNGDLHANVIATPESGLGATLSTVAIDLPPRGSAESILTLTTDRREPRPTQRVVRIQARAGQATANALVVLPITPVAARTEPWRLFPVTLSAYGTTDGTHVGLQPEIRGVGPLDTAKRWSADFLARGPDANGTGAFAQRDEYRLSVAGPGLTGRVGDQIYALSPLTTPGRYGRGGAIDLALGAARMGAFAVQERFTTDPDTELGGHAGVDAGRLGHYAVNFLHRLGGDDATLWSATVGGRPWGVTTVDAEVAADASRPELAWAGRLDAVASLPKGVSITARETFAAPEFGGYESDVHRTEASVGAPLSTALLAHLSLLREERNLGLDPAEATAPTDYRADARLRWTPSDSWALESGLSGASNADRLGGERWDEGAVRLQLSRGVRRLYASVLALGGVHLDPDSGEVAFGGQVGGYVVVSPSARLSLRGYANWGTADVAMSSSLFAVDAAVGAALSWEPLHGLTAELQGRHALDSDAPEEQVEGELRYQFTNGPTVATRWNVRFGAAPETSGLLSVSIPVGVPIGRNLEAGAIEGRVYDADALGQPGIPGVKVRAGGIVAVTGRDGRFVFGRLAAGAYRLEIDRVSLGLDRVGVESLPRTVQVRGGAAQSVDIGTTRSASLRGVVMQVGTSAPRSTYSQVLVGGGGDTETHAVVGITVLLQHGNERVSRVTDGQGTYRADGLHPGRWSVSVAKDQIPVYFLLPHATEIDLTPGVTSVADIELQPMVRLIHMMDGGPVAVRDEDVRTPAPPAPRKPAAVVVPRAPLAATDADHDGWHPPRDCDDEDRAVRPFANEVCDGAKDEDCDGHVDEGCDGWDHAEYRARARVTDAGEFVGGNFYLSIWDTAGDLACTVSADWYDDGADVADDSCPDCSWAAHLRTSRIRVRGPRCDGVDARAIAEATGSFGLASDGAGGSVLLRWDGVDWVPVVDSPDGNDLEFRLGTPLPDP